MNQFFTSEPETFKPHDEKISISPQQAASLSTCILNPQPFSNGPVQCTSTAILHQEFAHSRNSELIIPPTCSSSFNIYCSNNSSCKDSEAPSHFEPTPTTSSSSSLIDDRPSTSAIENLSITETRKLKSSQLSFSTKPSTLARLRRIATYHPRILRKLGITLINVKNPKRTEEPSEAIRLPRHLSPSPPPPPRKLNFKSPFRLETKTSPTLKTDRSQPRVMSRNTPCSMSDAGGMTKPPSTPATPQGRPPVGQMLESAPSNICQESPLLVNLLSSNTSQNVMAQHPSNTPQTPRYANPANAFAAQQQMMRPTTLPPQPQQPMQQQPQIVYAQNHQQVQQMMQQQMQQAPMHNPYAMTAGGPMHMNRPPGPPQQMGTPTTPGGQHPMQVMGPPPPQIMQHMPTHPMSGPMDPRMQPANDSPPPKAKRKRPTKKQKEQMEQQKQMQQQQQNLMVAPGHLPQQMTAQEFYMMQQQQQRVPPVNMHLPQNMQSQQRMAYPPQYPPGYPQQQASTSIMPQGQFPGQQHGYPPGTMQQAQQQIWHHNPNIPPHMVGQPMPAEYQHQQLAAHQHLMQQQQQQQQQAQQHQGQIMRPQSQQSIEQPHTPLPPQTPTSTTTHQYPSPSPTFAMQQQQQQTPQDKLRMPPPVYSPQFAQNRPFMVQTPPGYPQQQAPGFPQQQQASQQQMDPRHRPASGQQGQTGDDFSGLSETMDFSDNVDDLMATISGGDADDFDLDSIEPTVQSNPNPLSSPPQPMMMMSQQQTQQANTQHFPPQSPANPLPPGNYTSQMSISAQSTNVNGPFHMQSQHQVPTPPSFMQQQQTPQQAFQASQPGMKTQQTPTTPTEIESPNQVGGKKAQAQQKKTAAANRNTNINSTIDAVLEMVNSKNVDEVGDIFAATQEANQNYAANASFISKTVEKKGKKSTSSNQGDPELTKKHSNGGSLQQISIMQQQQAQKVVFDTNGGSSAYMNAEYTGQAYTHFNGHIGNHAVEGQLGATQNIFTPPPGMEARTEMSFKMPDPATMHPNMPISMMKEEPPPPPKKSPSKKNRKKATDLSKEVTQPKEESDPFFTPEKTNG